jgi:hypothetical protein
MWVIGASAMALVGLLYLAAPFPVREDFGGSHNAAAENLPSRLTDEEFWRIVSGFSEAGGYFRSDNFLSNEGTYQRVIPTLKKRLRPGGVYLGVGPEQNFTYVVALEPKMAFIVDIRRQNMLEHLLYKALMERSADRADFLSGLFSRPRPSGLGVDSSPETLHRAYEASDSDSGLFDRNFRDVWNQLTETHGFQLSAEDEKTMRYVYNAFFEDGPDMSYMFLGSRGGGWGMPTYGELMSATDGAGRNWSFLGTEEQFRAVQQLQKRNLIVPLVGDFAGEKAVRSVGQYVREHNAILTAFYTSNVEQYLFQQGDDWKHFYANVATLPVDSNSTFIRFVLNGRGFPFGFAFGSRSSSVLCPIVDVLKAFNAGKIRGYRDITEMSH